SLLECFEVLKTENRCRRKYRDLLAVTDSLESSAHGNFSFAVTDVTTDEAIHRHRRFHILLDVADRSELVCGFLVRQRFFQFLLPFRSRRKRVARRYFAM